MTYRPLGKPGGLICYADTDNKSWYVRSVSDRMRVY